MAERAEKADTGHGRGKTHRRISNRSFYASAITEAERLRLPDALEIEGLDHEIALLRVRLGRLAEEQPENTTLLFKGIELLVKAVAARYRLSKKSKDDLSEAIEGVLTSIGGALGLEGFSGS
ncbi:MAG: hypothetical protein ACE5JL_12980 [Dehalococcoidia bacterium]